MEYVEWVAVVASNGRGGSPLPPARELAAKPRDPTGGSAACGSPLPPARECPRAPPPPWAGLRGVRGRVRFLAAELLAKCKRGETPRRKFF